MANPTIGNLQSDCGQVYDDLTNGTTAATALLTKAKTLVKDITGTTTGFDSAIRELADSQVVNQVLGNRTGVDWSSEGKAYGRKELVTMQRNFEAAYVRSMRVKGFHVDGVSFQFRVVNQ